MSDEYEKKIARMEIRREVVTELKSLIDGIALLPALPGTAPDGHILILSSYEIANLRAALQSVGYAAVVEPSPLQVLNNGDWLGQIVIKLQGLALDQKPNAESWDLAKYANKWAGSSPREKKLAEILEGLIGNEDQPCSFDHHGYCQEHGWFGEPGECGVRDARKLLGLE